MSMTPMPAPVSDRAVPSVLNRHDRHRHPRVRHVPGTAPTEYTWQYCVANDVFRALFDGQWTTGRERVYVQFMNELERDGSAATNTDLFSVAATHQGVAIQLLNADPDTGGEERRRLKRFVAQVMLAGLSGAYPRTFMFVEVNYSETDGTFTAKERELDLS